MQPQPTHYQLPDNTDVSVKHMVLGLALLFLTLLTAAGLVFYHAQSIARHVPFHAEQRFVKPYEDLIARFFSSDSSHPEIQNYLQTLGDELRQDMDIADDISIRVHYVDADIVNAFATLGGHIVIFKGLLDVLPDENSLAMVLAHEIAHVAHRDPIAAMGRGLALQMVYGFVTGGGASAEELIDLMGGSGMALFSRDQEKQADATALLTLNTHYGHVNGYRQFFEYVADLERQDNENETSEKSDLERTIPDWFASHPATDERLDLLDEQRTRLSAGLEENLPLPDSIRKLLMEAEVNSDK